MSAIQLENISYEYRSRYGVNQVLKGIDWAFERGNIYAIVGKSGSGKTTLLSLMAGLDLPTEGNVLADGVNTRTTDLDLYRRKNVSVVYQGFRLFPLLTALENVMYPLELSNVPAAQAKEQALCCMERVGLPAELNDRFPGMMSGGEQQRVAIARALASQTGIILADEPTGNLDESNSRVIIDLLSDLAHNANYCVIVVTHDLGVLPCMDQVLRMRDGRLSVFERF